MKGNLAVIAFSLAGTAVAEEHPGKKTYDRVCAACHASGVMKAPRMGDVSKWKKLAREGFNDLVGNALMGVRMMPAKGGEPELSDNEVAEAVYYMAAANGASFPEPTLERIAAARAEGERRAARRAAKR